MSINPFVGAGLRIIPGLTKRWHYEALEEGTHHAMVIIDSSGSTPKPNAFSSLVFGAMMIAYHYLNAGGTVAALNTSNREIHVHFTDKTRAEDVYRTIAAWQGGGTTLQPGHVRHVAEEGRGFDAFVFSDQDAHALAPGLETLCRYANSINLFVGIPEGQALRPEIAGLAEKLGLNLYPYSQADVDGLRASLKQALTRLLAR